MGCLLPVTGSSKMMVILAEFLQVHTTKKVFIWFHEFFCLDFFKCSGPLCDLHFSHEWQNDGKSFLYKKERPLLNNGRSYEYNIFYTNRSDRYSTITVAPMSITFFIQEGATVVVNNGRPFLYKKIILIGATVIAL